MNRRLLVALASVAASVVACTTATSTPPAPNTPGGSSTTRPSTTPSDEPTFQPGPGHEAVVAAAARRVDRIVFIVKENRTFDHLFGRFPGADGATEGERCDGSVVPLAPARDDSPGATHNFAAGITAINGGRMNCFDELSGGLAG